MNALIEQMREDRQARPVVSLFVVISIVAVMTTISFATFWYSDTKDLVKTIQQTSQIQSSGFQTTAEGVNDDGVFTVSELLFISETINAERDKLSPEVDFGGGDLQKTNLGF